MSPDPGGIKTVGAEEMARHTLATRKSSTSRSGTERWKAKWEGSKRTRKGEVRRCGRRRGSVKPREERRLGGREETDQIRSNKIKTKGNKKLH